MPNVSERLIVRLRAELGPERIPEGARAERTRASGSSSLAGAWSWFVMDANGAETYVGSQWPMGKLLRCRRWAIDWPTPGDRRDPLDRDIPIDPCQTCRRSDDWVCSPRGSTT